jgi:ATP-dependent DNA helicase RecQ
MAVRLTGRFAGGAGGEACRQATDRRWRAYAALKAFAEDATTCRRRQLLAHFADLDAPAPTGRCCDVCDPVVLPELTMRGARSRSGHGAGGGSRVSEGPPVDESQLAELKRWRSVRADGKPAYTVATNATLEELLRRRPADERALLEIRGVGPGFVSRHGEDVLAVLADLVA